MVLIQFFWLVSKCQVWTGVVRKGWKMPAGLGENFDISAAKWLVKSIFSRKKIMFSSNSVKESNIVGNQTLKIYP